ncbi:MAG: histidine phosphatase family protein [Trueperaceae bacterium]|nr:MAG: histidine phosphatase family protein [Trueperaceae bacterium]
MTERTLYLIRHAQADERGPRYPDDSLRPLIKKGHRQAEVLAAAFETLELPLDRLFSSPYLRALETARPLEGAVQNQRRLDTLQPLASSDYGELLSALSRQIGPGDNAVACVGHEPYLSELTSLLLTGDPYRLDTRFRKAATVILQGPIAAGAMELHGMLTARMLKRLL